MANKLEKFYSSFGGVDTRSNKLLMDPKTFRNGSKNFRYNFQDEIQNANGFQHKSPVTPVEFVDIFEYKYRDVNTGESRSEDLGVGVDGNLYRSVVHYLKWNTTAGASYSFFYNELTDEFNLTVNGSTVVVSMTMTLNQLKTALNALPGIVVDIVDQDGVSVTSSHLAYLLDCVIDNKFTLNNAPAWEVVFCSSIPFPNAITRGEGYEGISSINLNNVIYMTDGWFMMKYDGRSVYRAGMPRFTRDLGFDGVTLDTEVIGNMTPNAAYRYIQQFGFVDYNGVETLGKISESDFLKVSLPPGQQSVFVPVYPIGNADATNDCFPVYSCSVNGNQTLSGTGSKVLTVNTGHNIAIGMCLRLTVSNIYGLSVQQGISFGYLEVTATSATTITFNKTINGLVLLQSGFGGPYSPMWLNNTSTQTPDMFPDDFVINGAYVPGEVIGTFSEPDIYSGIEQGMTQAWSPGLLYGAFVRVWRSKGNAVDQLYKLGDFPISHSVSYLLRDQLADTDGSPNDTLIESLTTIQIDYAAGEEIPRSSKYVTKWQDILVNSGRPFNEPGILGKDYPYYYAPPAPTVGNKWGLNIPYPPWQYQENNLCDLQSIYWAGPLTPEGFPQDGLHEFPVDTLASDRIKGAQQNKDALFVFKERSTALLTGDLGTNDLSMEVLEGEIGLISHRTLQEVKGAAMWLDGDGGFYACVAGRLPEHVGYPICDYQQINSQGLDYTQSSAMNARNIGMYICAVGSTWFVFDYSETATASRSCWYIWERFTAASMSYTSRGDILLLGDQVWKMKVTNTRFDMTDHKSAIEMDARTAWINFGAPTIDKRWERFWLNSIQGGFTLAVDQYGNYIEDLLGSSSMTFKPDTETKLTVKDWIKAKIDKLSAISIGFRNAEKNKLVRIQGFEIEYAPDYDGSEPKR